MGSKETWTHRMISKDPDNMRGVCAACGPVELARRKTRTGRGGYRCLNGYNLQHGGRAGPQRHALPRQKVLDLRKGKTCEICGDTERLVVDHCHDTKKIRGVICNRCNIGLGMFQDNVDKIRNAIIYLEK